MKNFKKSLIVLSFIFVSLMCFNNAFAEITFGLTSPQILMTTIPMSCSSGDIVLGYYPSTNTLAWAGPCSDSFYADSEAGVYNLVECNSLLSPSACADTGGVLNVLSGALSDAGFVSQTTFTYTEIPPVVPSLFSDGLIFSKEEGAYTASTLLASVATGAQTTFADLGPVLVIVGGIIFAIIFIRFFIHLVKITSNARRY